MEKLPTAEEFAKYELTLQHINLNEKTSWKWSDVQILMITFAKLHVQAALQVASETARAKEDPADYGTGEIWVDKQSILSAYPLTNIK
jgi:hypothetical protein